MKNSYMLICISEFLPSTYDIIPRNLIHYKLRIKMKIQLRTNTKKKYYIYYHIYFTNLYTNKFTLKVIYQKKNSP